MPYERYTGNTQISVLPRTVKRCLTFNKKNSLFCPIPICNPRWQVHIMPWVNLRSNLWMKSNMCFISKLLSLGRYAIQNVWGVSWESYHACFGATLALLYSLGALCLYIKIKSLYLILNPPSHQWLAHNVPVFFRRGAIVQLKNMETHHYGWKINILRLMEFEMGIVSSLDFVIP